MSDMIVRGSAKAFAVVSSNQTVASLTAGTGADCRYGSKAEVRVLLANADNTCTITPAFGVGTVYALGSPVTLDGANGTTQVFTLEVRASQDVNFVVSDLAGTTPSATITVIPLERS